MKKHFLVILFIILLSDYTVAAERSTSGVAETSHALFYIYANWFSPQNGAVCEFRPVCSEYSRQSFLRYGFTRGLLMSTDRLIRDNPFVEPYEDHPHWYMEDRGVH